LSYLIQHAAALGVYVRHPPALALLLLLPVFLRYRRHAAGRWADRFRATAFCCVVAVLAGVQLTVRLPDHRLSLVAALDLSASTTARARDWERQYAAAAGRALAPGDEMAVLTFAADTVVATPPGPPAAIEELPDPTRRGATDIAQAIDAALGLLGAEGERRILLLSDGNQTRGDVRRRLPTLRAEGIRIYAAVPPAGNDADVSLDKLVTPPLVTEGTVFPLRMVAHNDGEQRPAVLNLFLDDAIVDSAPIVLPPGFTAFEVPYRLTGPGSHRLRAELSVHGDAVALNNDREVSITVGGKTRVLLVTGRPHPLLPTVLKSREIEVDVRPPSRAPSEIDELRNYHCVVFEDLTGSTIGKRQLEALDSYVRDFGGGFVLVGGVRTFGDVRLRDTALRRLLPVTLEPRRPIPRSREPLALVILVDRSNSMGYNSRLRTLRDGEKLRYAKEAALSVVRQLRDRDLVGVTVFDSRKHVIAPLRPLSDNREQLETDLPRVVENGGTDFFDALQEAREELAAARVNRRHVILLTDGDTNRPAPDHYPLIADLEKAGISVTTIRIGNDEVNLRLLRDISGQTGGEFYHVRNVELLPDLMLRDTSRALEPGTGSEQFLPAVAANSEILLGIPASSIPPLSGYAYARPRPGTEVLLRVARIDRHDPILAVWQYGLGRVAAFTASTIDDAERWPAWADFGRFWSQLVRWTVPTEKSLDYAVEARRSEGVAELTIRTFDPDCSDEVVRARLLVPPDGAREMRVTPSGPCRFVARLPGIRAGRYALTVVRRHGNGSLSEDTQLASIPEKEDEPRDEHRFAGPNLALLTDLTEYTGGKLDPKPADVGHRTTGTRRHHYPLDFLLLPLAMVLFLADVAVRRVHGSTARGAPQGSHEVAPAAEDTSQ